MTPTEAKIIVLNIYPDAKYEILDFTQFNQGKLFRIKTNLSTTNLPVEESVDQAWLSTAKLLTKNN